MSQEINIFFQPHTFDSTDKLKNSNLFYTSMVQL